MKQIWAFEERRRGARVCRHSFKTAHSSYSYLCALYTQREMIIKGKMANDAWLSTITDSADAKFRGHLQLKGPFTAMMRSRQSAAAITTHRVSALEIQHFVGRLYGL